MKRYERILSSLAIGIGVAGLFYYGNGNLLNPDYCEAERCDSKSLWLISVIFVATTLVVLRITKKITDRMNYSMTYDQVCNCTTYNEEAGEWEQAPECYGDCEDDFEQYADLMQCEGCGTDKFRTFTLNGLCNDCYMELEDEQ